MNKVELEAAVAEQLGVSQAEVKRTFSAIIDTMIGSLQRGESVKIVRFGTLEPRLKKERRGKSPVDGSDITIPASCKVGFKPGKDLQGIDPDKL